MLLAPEAGVDDLLFTSMLLAPEAAGVIERFLEILTLLAPETADKSDRSFVDRKAGSLDRWSVRGRSLLCGLGDGFRWLA